jgi:hypothetical protein
MNLYVCQSVRVEDSGRKEAGQEEEEEIEKYLPATRKLIITWTNLS